MKTQISATILAIATCGLAMGQSYTNPVGYETIDIRPSSFNYIGIRLHNPILITGSMAATSATTVQDPGADFSSLTGANTFYVLEVLNSSGYVVEFIGGGVSGDVITIPDDLQSLGTFDYQIRAAATLASVFGETNSAGLSAGFFGPGSADVIYVPDGSGSFDRYYYDTGYASWYNAKASTAVTGSQIPLVYADGVIISATASAPASITIAGAIKPSITSATLMPGFNYLSTVAPASATLKSSFDTSELAAGFFGPGGADVIYVPDGTGGFNRYYYDSGYVGWVDAATNDALSPADGSGVTMASGVVVSATSQKTITLGVPDSYSGL